MKQRRSPFLPAFLAAALLWVSAAPASAEIPMSGRFVAEATCAASLSIREPTRNPGDIATEAGRSYRLVARNASPGSHYLIIVPEAEPQRRWVAFGCGRVEEEAESDQAAAPPEDHRGQRPRRDATGSERYVLAASWHPAFCEAQPRARDCRSGGVGGGFSLHGLWPQPRGTEYCGVPARLVAADEEGGWLDLPEPDMPEALARRLAEAMPGVSAGLDRHEWIKHGSCYPGGAKAYFEASLRLLDELNASGVSDLFRRSLGRRLSASEIRASFDEAFGDGAGERVLVDCTEADGRRLIGELRVEIAGRPDADAELSRLIHAAPAVPPGCRSGEVDRPGFG